MRQLLPVVAEDGDFLAPSSASASDDSASHAADAARPPRASSGDDGEEPGPGLPREAGAPGGAVRLRRHREPGEPEGGDSFLREGQEKLLLLLALGGGVAPSSFAASSSTSASAAHSARDHLELRYPLRREVRVRRDEPPGERRVRERRGRGGRGRAPGRRRRH